MKFNRSQVLSGKVGRITKLSLKCHATSPHRLFFWKSPPIKFSNLQAKYPIIQPNLEKCFKEIQAKFVGQLSSKEDKKGKVKKLLKLLMDMKHLEMSYQGLIDETASKENELIQLLKKLSEASLSCKKKTTMFASRQGRLIERCKDISFKTDVQACSRYVRVYNALCKCSNFILPAT